MVRVLKETIAVDDVILFDKERYNTNNHWEEGLGRPADYEQKLEENNTRLWIDHFKSYEKIEISLTGSESWLIQAFEIGRHTGKFPESYAEERDELVAKLSSQFHFDGKEYFIRTENVSLKCGQHGAGPYTAMAPVIESLVSCVTGHTPICLDSRGSITLYFIPWVHIDPKREYRVFICEGRMTAISQQHCYTVYEDDFDRVADVQLIHRYFVDSIRPVIAHSSYSIDIAVLEEEGDSGPPTASRVYFIEINCFGKEYAAGSSLFGWLQDEDILYGRRSGVTQGALGEGKREETELGEEGEVIYLRYTVRSS
jgi:hypothetical protein